MSVLRKLQPITETSCLVNVMHEILVDRWKKRIPSIAICPTQRLERHLGYDVALPDFEKILGLQFKAYRRYNFKCMDYFQIKRKQHAKLRSYSRNCAFYVFPDYKTHSHMSRDRRLELQGSTFMILNNTWFVEVHDIPIGTTKVRRNQLLTGQIPSLTWQRLSALITKCWAGFRITERQKRYVLFDTEEKLTESIAIPSGRFSLFYTRLGPEKSNDQVSVSFS
jgi:hypothetical protein